VVAEYFPDFLGLRERWRDITCKQTPQPEMTTLRPRVLRAARALVAGIASSAIASTAYLWLTPLLAPALSLVSRPRDSFPWWAPAAVKLVESLLLSITCLANRTTPRFSFQSWFCSAWDAALVGTIGRAPFLDLLLSSYPVSWHTILSLYFIDIFSLVFPLVFLATSVAPYTPYDDLQLSTYTSLLSATFLSLPLFYLSARFLPLTLTMYFDGATSVNPMPLPYFIALNIPAGFALQKLLARYGVKGALVVVANILITGSGLMYYGVAGAEIRGVEVINGMWIVSLLVSMLATYGFVLRKWVLEFGNYANFGFVDKVYMRRSIWKDGKEVLYADSPFLYIGLGWLVEICLWGEIYFKQKPWNWKVGGRANTFLALDSGDHLQDDRMSYDRALSVFSPGTQPPLSHFPISCTNPQMATFSKSNMQAKPSNEGPRP
jgi:hypothetical protein